MHVFVEDGCCKGSWNCIYLFIWAIHNPLSKQQIVFKLFINHNGLYRYISFKYLYHTQTNLPLHYDDGMQPNTTAKNFFGSRPCQMTSTPSRRTLLKPRYDPLHNGRPHLAYLLSPTLDEYYHKHSETRKTERNQWKSIVTNYTPHPLKRLFRFLDT